MASFFTEKVPPKPQHTSVSFISRSSRPLNWQAGPLVHHECHIHVKQHMHRVSHHALKVEPICVSLIWFTRKSENSKYSFAVACIRCAKKNCGTFQNNNFVPWKRRKPKAYYGLFVRKSRMNFSPMHLLHPETAVKGHLPATSLVGVIMNSQFEPFQYLHHIHPDLR